jgi:hypothetical protein
MHPYRLNHTRKTGACHYPPLLRIRPETAAPCLRPNIRGGGYLRRIGGAR